MSEHHSHSIDPQPAVIPADKAKIAKIWKTAGILALVTIIEFVFAFLVARGPVLITIFVLLTLVKAFFIVFEFMHLGHEKRSLKLSVLLPIIFLLWLILAALMEADAILKAIELYWK